MMHLNKQLNILLPIGSSDGNVATVWNQIDGCHFAQALVLDLHATAKYVLHVSFELYSSKSQWPQNHQPSNQSPGASISNHEQALKLFALNQTYQPENIDRVR